MTTAHLRLSSFAVVIPLGGDRAFAGHAVRGTRLVVDGLVGRVLSALGGAKSVGELELALAGDERLAEDPSAVVRIVAELRARGLVTESTPAEELQEASDWVERAHLGASDADARERMRERFAPAEEWQSPPPAVTRRAVVLGWCTAEALAPALQEEARARGVALDVTTGFESDAALARERDADFTLLVLGNFRLLAPLFAAAPDDTGERELVTASEEVQRLVSRASESTRGPLLVTGCVSPQAEPLGLSGSLQESSLADRCFELNRRIRRVVAATPNAVYVDLDRLLARAGKADLLDDLEAPWAHAGVAGGARNTRYHRLVARACLDALDAALGTRRIRCLAVDLDGVLWPGEIADPELSLSDDRSVESLRYGLHGGIHEALRALKARGVLLAAVSKNARDGVLEKWNDRTWANLGPESVLLTPGDFVALEIGWTEKSQSILRLAEELGVQPSAIAFLDDDPRERAEVAHALPDVWVLDVPLEKARELLLTSPRFETLERSPEARERAGATRARLARDRAGARAHDHAAFLASLAVRCTLRHAKDERELDRAAELVARTNQFRTTSERPSRRELAALARDPNATITTLEVRDRFGRYGVTGVALSVGHEVRLLTLSCRVIGAEVHDVLLRAAVEECRARAADADVLVRFEETPHNAPTRRLFDGADFVEHALGRALKATAALPPWPAHCSVSRP